MVARIKQPTIEELLARAERKKKQLDAELEKLRNEIKSGKLTLKTVHNNAHISGDLNGALFALEQLLKEKQV